MKLFLKPRGLTTLFPVRQTVYCVNPNERPGVLHFARMEEVAFL